jgi:hypothetical protein
MLIKTTVYMHNEILSKIIKITGNNKKLRSSIIISFLKRVMKDNKNMVKLFRSVKYQDSDKKENWKTIHVSFREDDYEYFIDMRKLYKMSVSLIVSYAVKKYFFEIMNKLIGKFLSDNNHPNNYLLADHIVDGIVCWRLYWGFPPDPKEIFHTP